jgi:ABC-2 type transport system permease protein
MRKYVAIFKSHLSTVFEYRSVPVVWALIELLTVASAVFFWLAVYRTQGEVGNYQLSDMLAYYLLVPFVGSITYVHLSSSFPKKIKDGQISTDLLKPFNLSISLFLKSISSMILKQTTKLPIIFITMTVFFSFVRFNWSLKNILLGLVVCVFSFMLHFVIDLCMSYLAFWMDDIWSFEHLKLVALMIFGGMTFPLSLLTGKLQWFFSFLPFRFIYFFPISVIQGMVSIDKLATEIFTIIAWTLFFYIISRFLWREGLKKYGAYGN